MFVPSHKSNLAVGPNHSFSTRVEVDRANKKHLDLIKDDRKTFRAEDSPPAIGGSQKNTYLSNLMAPEVLDLKVGAQVMLVKNMDLNLVNGTIGTVKGFGSLHLDDSEDDESPEAAKKKAKFVEAVLSGREELSPVVEWRTPSGVIVKTMVREEFKADTRKGDVNPPRRRQVSPPSGPSSL